MEKVLEVKGLNKSFGDRQVLHDINFEIYPNEIVGFIGHNGAGKSTVMKCIMSLIFPDSGEIIVNGYDLKKDRIKALESMAGVIEEPGLFKDMSGEDNLRLFAELRSVPEERIQEMIEFTRLGDSLSRKTADYSMGMKQKLALAIALLSKPRLLILDEPTNGLDPTAVMELRQSLLDLVEKEDISILFSSHQLEEVDKLSDRLVSINRGRIIDLELMTMDREVYILDTEDGESFQAFLDAGAYDYIQLGPGSFELTLQDEKIHQFLIRLAGEGIELDRISFKELSLEESYKRIYMDTSQV